VAERAPDSDPNCDVAHGQDSLPAYGDRQLVVVYASPLGSYLLHWGRELGFATTLVEPDRDVVTQAHRTAADHVVHDPADLEVPDSADVVVSDHHRADLGAVLAPLVRASPRWVGIIGSPRHEGPHVRALEDEGVDASAIATVRRPIGVDIGSKSPAEIAISILAGLIADRNGRDGGLAHPTTHGAG
jgi:xanthine dehydrogenase accessory factor